jgi:hypothetical protein
MAPYMRLPPGLGWWVRSVRCAFMSVEGDFRSPETILQCVHNRHM